MRLAEEVEPVADDDGRADAHAGSVEARVGAGQRGLPRDARLLTLGRRAGVEDGDEEPIALLARRRLEEEAVPALGEHDPRPRPECLRGFAVHDGPQAAHVGEVEAEGAARLREQVREGIGHAARPFAEESREVEQRRVSRHLLPHQLARPVASSGCPVALDGREVGLAGKRVLLDLRVGRQGDRAEDEPVAGNSVAHRLAGYAFGGPLSGVAEAADGLADAAPGDRRVGVGILPAPIAPPALGSRKCGSAREAHEKAKYAAPHRKGQGPARLGALLPTGAEWVAGGFSRRTRAPQPPKSRRDGRQGHGPPLNGVLPSLRDWPRGRLAIRRLKPPATYSRPLGTHEPPRWERSVPSIAWLCTKACWGEGRHG